MKTKGHNSSKKRLVAALLCLCMLIGLMPGMGTAAFAASQYNIGDTVLFAGYEWYIIGTETEGVKAPSGCYTLFAKNNDFGETTFGNGHYMYSELKTKMEETADSFSDADRASIEPRAVVNGVMGTEPTDQLVWAIGASELNEVSADMKQFDADYYTRLTSWDGNKYYATFYQVSSGQTADCLITDSKAVRPALYVKAEELPESAKGIQVAFGGQWWYVVGQGVSGSVPGPENTVTLFENPSAPPRPGVATATEYMGSDLQEAMAGFGSNLTLAGKESSLIVPRTLTTADGITGSTAADQPFWPLSKTEAERIGNTDILKAENINPLACYWLRTPEGSENYVYAVDRLTGSVIRERSNGVYGVRPAFYLDISNAFYLAQDAKKTGGNSIGVSPYPLEWGSGSLYKYTIFDDSLKLSVTADPTQASQTGNTLSFGYVATTGEKTYLACVLTADGDNNVLYYSALVNLTEASAASGTVNIPLTGVADGDYTMRLYTEQQNYNSTDFASPSVDVQITVNSGVASIRNLGNVQLVGDSGGQGGEDGREVELRTNEETRQIQWRYVGEGDDAWRDLVALDAITGGDGADGREVQLRVDSGYIQWKYDTDSQWTNLLALSDLKGDPGEDGHEVELQNNGTSIQWRYKGETEWKDLVALSDITGSDGADGKQVELRVEGGYIQWKYDADSDWQNLIALSALQGIKGDKGDKGDPGEDGDTPYIGDNGNWWIGTTDTGINASGTDGSNGSNGSDGEDGQDGKDGTDGLTPYIGSNGNWWIGTTDTGIKAAGTNGANGQNGTNGKNGADGVGIADIKLNENGELIITLTDGTENNLGKVKGEDGVGISGVSINENGELIVTLTNGTELNAGIVRTAETAAAMGSTEISHLKTLVYVSVGIASVSLAGLIGLLAFLLTRRKSLIGK